MPITLFLAFVFIFTNYVAKTFLDVSSVVKSPLD